MGARSSAPRSWPRITPPPGGRAWPDSPALPVPSARLRGGGASVPNGRRGGGGGGAPRPPARPAAPPGRPPAVRPRGPPDHPGADQGPLGVGDAPPLTRTPSGGLEEGGGCAPTNPSPGLLATVGSGYRCLPLWGVGPRGRHPALPSAGPDGPVALPRHRHLGPGGRPRRGAPVGPGLPGSAGGPSTPPLPIFPIRSYLPSGPGWGSSREPPTGS